MHFFFEDTVYLGLSESGVSQITWVYHIFSPLTPAQIPDRGWIARLWMDPEGALKTMVTRRILWFFDIRRKLWIQRIHHLSCLCDLYVPWLKL